MHWPGVRPPGLCIVFSLLCDISPYTHKISASLQTKLSMQAPCELMDSQTQWNHRLYSN